MWIQPRPLGLCSAVRGYWWKEPFSSVSGRFHLLSLRSGEKMSFPGWSTDLHISPNINISSQQHSNRCTWSDKVSSTKPARGVTYKQMSSGTQLLALQMPEMRTQNDFYLFVILFVISGVWQALLTIHFHWMDKQHTTKYFFFIPQETENHSGLE